MTEYIDKQALITEIQSSVSMVLQTAPYKKVWFDRFVDRQNEIMAIIERQPTAEVEPVRHGTWEPCFEDWRKQIEGDKCSACGFEHYGCSIRVYHYCPNCGARNDGGADNG